MPIVPDIAYLREPNLLVPGEKPIGNVRLDTDSALGGMIDGLGENTKAYLLTPSQGFRPDTTVLDGAIYDPPVFKSASYNDAVLFRQDLDLEIPANWNWWLCVKFRTTDGYGPICILRNMNDGTPIVGIYIGFNGIQDVGSGRITAITRDNLGQRSWTKETTGYVSDGEWHTAMLLTQSGVTSLYLDGVYIDGYAAKLNGYSFSTGAQTLFTDRIWIRDNHGTSDMRTMIGEIEFFFYGADSDYVIPQEDIQQFLRDPYKILAPA